ncbi:ATP-dependent RNA helicase TDRD9-like isoform X2 [Ictalurus furcatus]|uniref:ATP-dependent RNA helicase TDRD9-like isoform X2 n=1 Tax=Ictalurus furcatus TaxID=66913 RepID=UPI002350DDFA|nr:ATP-dependent RNA helicase TDRD9-like isoform X2 [Ictalurus furcatus]
MMFCTLVLFCYRSLSLCLSHSLCVCLSLRVNVDFQNQSVSPVGVLSSSIELENLPSNPVFIVNITAVIEVGHFWGFQAHEASLEKQRWLTVAVNTRALRPLPVSLYPNLLCLAPFSETHTKPGNYYRAKILHVMGSNVEVFFVDFGNTSKVPCNSLWNFLLTGKLCPFRYCLHGNNLGCKH